MRQRLLRLLPWWVATALWWTGMVFGGLLALGLLASSVQAAMRAVTDASPAAAVLALAYAGLGVITGRWWLAELRRRQAITPAALRPD